jgi:hypothetical protein
MCEYHRDEPVFFIGCNQELCEWHIPSECGHYIQIWRGGKIIDEVPA